MPKPNKGETERRLIKDSEFRYDKEQRKLVGYAAVFNTWTDIGGWFREAIAPGAFAKTIKEADVRALINHDPNLVLGRNKSGTLKLWEDSRGLLYEVTLPDTSYAKDLVESISRGDISQNSFAFRSVKEEWDKEEKKRTIIEARLFDVSPVTYPAYPTTSLALREEVLSGLGFDIEEFSSAIIRAKEGKASAEDFEILKRVSEAVVPLIAPQKEPGEAHSEENQEPDQSTLRQKARSIDIEIELALNGRR